MSDKVPTLSTHSPADPEVSCILCDKGECEHELTFRARHASRETVGVHQTCLENRWAVGFADSPPQCSGEWVDGSGGHRTHGTPCTLIASWTHPEDPYAYCDRHIVDGDKPLYIHTPGIRPDALDDLIVQMYAVRALLTRQRRAAGLTFLETSALRHLETALDCLEYQSAGHVRPNPEPAKKPEG